MGTTYDIVIVGAGIFGVTTALELTARGHSVAVLDPGPIPHPLAASTDISKAVRMEYGADEDYMALVEQALPRWRQWNEELPEPLFHEVGVTMITRAPMQPTGFEYESYHNLLKRGHHPDRLNADEIARRFPAWKPGEYVDGFFHAQGGFAESGRLVAALIDLGKTRGIAFHSGQTAQDILSDHNRITGVRTREGETFAAGQVLIAAGAWTPVLVPEIASFMRATGHPVFHLKPANPANFTPPQFTVFTADITNTGWYGFPLHPREGVVKIANHGVGQRLHPENDPRVVTDDDVQHLRQMLAYSFPELLDAPITYTRRCLYCDTLDEHLWIDRHPERSGLIVAAGGSGHGFKFAPVLGDLIADAVEAKPNPALHKFRWRDLGADTTGEEAARYHA